MMLQKSAHSRWVVVDWCVLWHRSYGDKHCRGLGQAIPQACQLKVVLLSMLMEDFWHGDIGGGEHYAQDGIAIFNLMAVKILFLLFPLHRILILMPVMLLL
jgi:hypothetical protein